MEKWIIVISLLRRISSVKRRPIIRVQRPPIAQSVNQVRVCDIMPSHGDNISLSALELRYHVVAVEVPTSQEGDSCWLKDFAEDVEGIGLFGLSHSAVRVAVRVAVSERSQFLLLVEHLIEAGFNPA